jgi:hypothetical protein
MTHFLSSPFASLMLKQLLNCQLVHDSLQAACPPALSSAFLPQEPALRVRTPCRPHPEGKSATIYAIYFLLKLFSYISW